MALYQPLLDMLTATHVEMIYNDYETHGRFNISVWQARIDFIPEGAYMIGQVAVPDHVSVIPPSSVILVKPLVQSDAHGELIMPPVDFELVWNDEGSGGRYDGSFWRVQPPEGYVALGDVACRGYEQPSEEFKAKYACIRRDLLCDGTVDPTPVWTDVGSGASMCVSIWNVNGNGLGGFYKAQEGYNRPSYEAFVLCGGPYWVNL